MPLLLVHLLRDIIFILDLLTGLVHGIREERINLLRISEADSLVEHQLAHHVQVDVAFQLRVEDAERLV